MNLRSRLFDALKTVDAVVGRPLAACTAPRRPLPAHPRDVLVVRLWGLGNLALVVPHLRATRGDARMRILTLERNAAFLREQVPSAAVLALPDPVSPRAVPALARTLVALRRDPPDVVVDLEQFLRLPLALVRGASGAPAAGLDTPGQGRAPLLDAAVAYDPTRHVADTFAAVWRAAGLPTGDGPGPLRVDPDALASFAGEAWTSRDRGPLVVLHPGSGDHFPGRRWSPERFGALARRLAATHHARVALTGLPGEAALLRRVAHAAGDVPVADLCGRLDDRALVALLARADLLVTNDTGPLHLADAVSTPAVALYGPNTPHRYGPRLPASRAVFADLPCSPCLDDRSMKRSACRRYRCMEALDVAAVARACAEALGGRARATPAVRPEVHAVHP